MSYPTKSVLTSVEWFAPKFQPHGAKSRRSCEVGEGQTVSKPRVWSREDLRGYSSGRSSVPLAGQGALSREENDRWDCLACSRRSVAYVGTGVCGREVVQRESRESGSLPPPCPSA